MSSYPCRSHSFSSLALALPFPLPLPLPLSVSVSVSVSVSRPQTEFRGRFGSLWRSRFGPLDLVNVASPELVLRLLDQEGARPVRVELSHWREYREARGRGLGLHVR